MGQLEKEEHEFRSQLGYAGEDHYSQILADSDLLHQNLYGPDEKWVVENDLGQHYYTHITKIEEGGIAVFFILICSYIDQGPSFVFYRTVTRHLELVEKYRRDQKFDAEVESEQNTMSEEEEDILNNIPSEVFDDIEFRKSEALAHLLTHKSEADIPIEKFIEYDVCMETTINFPDEIYENDDETLTYIKLFNDDKGTYTYYVLMLKISVQNMTEKPLMPILGFPSQDAEIYKTYATGKRMNETLKN